MSECEREREREKEKERDVYGHKVMDVYLPSLLRLIYM